MVFCFYFSRAGGEDPDRWRGRPDRLEEDDVQRAVNETGAIREEEEKQEDARPTAPHPDPAATLATPLFTPAATALFTPAISDTAATLATPAATALFTPAISDTAATLATPAATALFTPAATALFTPAISDTAATLATPLIGPAAIALFTPAIDAPHSAAVATHGVVTLEMIFNLITTQAEAQKTLKAELQQQKVQMQAQQDMIKVCCLLIYFT
jgi:hypothetical protein